MKSIDYVWPATTNLLERPDVVVVATVSCIYGLGSPKDYRDMRIRIDQGQTLDIDSLRRKLIEPAVRA